jgi:hypothetical protein
VSDIVLNDKQVADLMRLIVRDFRNEPFGVPSEAEPEPAYTRRCLAPVLRGTLRRLKVPGLVLIGSAGGIIPQPVPLFGQRFYPDLAVAQQRGKLVAFEVKYLKADFRESAIATAIGQAYLYRQAGYRASGVLFIDQVGVMSKDEIIEGQKVCGLGGVELVVRRRLRDRLVEHPS